MQNRFLPFPVLLVPALVGVLSCALLAPQSAWATTYNVKTSGVDDSAHNGTTQPWRTLGYALKRVTNNYATDGVSNTIQLGDGSFPEATHQVTEYVGTSNQRTVTRADLVKIPSNIIRGNGSHRTKVSAVVPPLAYDKMQNFQPEILSWEESGSIMPRFAASRSMV